MKTKSHKENESAERERALRMSGMLKGGRNQVNKQEPLQQRVLYDIEMCAWKRECVALEKRAQNKPNRNNFIKS